MSELVPVEAAPAALVLLRAAIASLDEQRADLAHQGEWEALTAGVVQLDALLRDLRELRRACEQDVVELIPAKKAFVEGVGFVEVKTDIRRRNWQSRDLAMAAVANAVEAGDVDHPMDVVELMLAMFSISAAKVTALRERGFDPDEWCETEWGHRTIRVTT